MDMYIVLLAAVMVLLVLHTVRRHVDKEHRHVVELSTGETFLGVLDRGYRNYLFIGDNPRKSYGDVTPEEAEFLKYLVDKEGL